MTPNLGKNISSVLSSLKNKEFSAVELANQYLDKIEKDQSNSFITINREWTIEQAKQSDVRISSGNALPFDGIPIAMKDLFCTKGIRTTCASKMLENFVPNYDATVVDKLRNLGAVILGKTNMDEFAMGSANVNSYFGAVISPLKAKNNNNLRLTPGGSSGGSAAAVAEDLCIFATGSDTGGSIREPASFCGAVGMKPSYGLVSRYGMIAYASSLDQGGIIAKNVEDTVVATQAIIGDDSKDMSMKKGLKIDLISNLKQSLKGKNLTLGVPKECLNDSRIAKSTLQAWHNAIDLLQKDCDCKIVEISLEKSINYGPYVYYAISTAEAFSNLARYDGIKFGHRSTKKVDNLKDFYINNRMEGFGAEVKRRIMLGAFVLSAENYEKNFIQATKIRQMICDEFSSSFEKIDAIIMPTVSDVAFSIDEPYDEIKMFMNDIFTLPVNLAGLPGISVPFGKDETSGLPIGLQVITKAFDDAKMCNIAYNLEQLNL